MGFLAQLKYPGGRFGQHWGNICHGNALIEAVGEGLKVVLK
jgi:hypothetical protein